MKAVQYTVRVPAAVDKAMQKLAAQQNVTPYEMHQRCVKAGVAALTNPPIHGANDRELVAELASVSTGVAHVERMLDRVLFTACASYCYARSAALAGGKTEEDIKEDCQCPAFCPLTLCAQHPNQRPSRGPVAQLVEQLTFNQRVTGSNPVRLTMTPKGLSWKQLGPL